MADVEKLALYQGCFKPPVPPHVEAVQRGWINAELRFHTRAPGNSKEKVMTWQTKLNVIDDGGIIKIGTRPMTMYVGRAWVGREVVRTTCKVLDTKVDIGLAMDRLPEKLNLAPNEHGLVSITDSEQLKNATDHKFDWRDLYKAVT